MPPLTKKTAAQVESDLKKRIVIPCLPHSHRVNIFGNCPCGRYKEGKP